MEILDCRVVLPTFVKCRQAGQDYNLFVYIDHVNKDVIIVDDDGLLGDRGELKKAIYAHIRSKDRLFQTPPTPSEGFAKLKPETYVN